MFSNWGLPASIGHHEYLTTPDRPFCHAVYRYPPKTLIFIERTMLSI
jgi:hypothetical protein